MRCRFRTFVPDSFDYAVDILNRNNETVKRLSGTVPTNGQNLVPVFVTWNGILDDNSQLPFDGYKINFSVDAKEAGSISTLFCTGVQAEPCKWIEDPSNPCRLICV